MSEPVTTDETPKKKKPIRRPGTWRVTDRRKTPGRTGWVGTFITAERKQRSQSFPTKAAAEKWASEAAAKVTVGTHIDGTMTLRQWCDQWLAGFDARASTTASTKSRIARFGVLMDKPLADIGTSDVKIWLKGLNSPERGLKSSTVHATWKQLRQVLDAAVEHKPHRLIQDNPATLKTRLKEVEGKDHIVVPDDEMWAAFSSAPAPLANMILLARFAGLRFGEAHGLRWANVGTDSIAVVEQRDGARLKTTASKGTVPVDPAVLAMLVDNDTDHVTGGWTYRQLADEFRGMGLGWTMHDLRHSYGSYLNAAGVDIVTISKLLRHSTVDITARIYLHETPEAERLAQEAAAKAFTPPVLKAV